MSLSNQTNHLFELDLFQTESAQTKPDTESLKEALIDFGPIDVSPLPIDVSPLPIGITPLPAPVIDEDWIDLFDNPGDDILAGDAGKDFLNGGSDNDSLKGNKGNDSLNGGSGNDSLFGGSGNDVLDGTADSYDLFDLGDGSGEIDHLTGGRGADTFVLGEVSSSGTGYGWPSERIFYSDDGVKDYALISDFNSTKDTVQLAGSATDYKLGASPKGLPKGTAIYHGNPAGNEVIGVLQGTSVSDFSSGFTFVSSNIDDWFTPIIPIDDPTPILL